ncbi:MAG TPA: chorismate synthase [Anaerolineae bacterium]|nr:chorismate synthase [Anaerolineae bacterium]
MLRFLTAGESHGPGVVAILEGMPAGLPLQPEDINGELLRRQTGYGSGPRMKIEKDEAEIVGGVMAGVTIGAPIALLIRNLDHVKWKGKPIDPMPVPRPGHADLTAAIKYGYTDLRYSLERASARETAARVAVGAVCRRLLSEFGIRIGSYVTAIGEAQADLVDMSLEERLDRAEASPVRCPSPEATEAMEAEIRAVMQAKDTLGGVFAVVALGLPPGLGSHVHWDRRLGSRLSAALMGIHAIKGVEIGEAFANARRRGTQAHDEIFAESDRLVRQTNRSGGLEGGITTGEPLIVHAAMKPISTTLNPLRSVDLASGEATTTRYERSDFCAVPRAAVVGEAMLAIALADALLEKLGGDALAELRPRFDALRQARLADLPMANEPIVFWE